MLANSIRFKWVHIQKTLADYWITIRFYVCEFLYIDKLCQWMRHKIETINWFVFEFFVSPNRTWIEWSTSKCLVKKYQINRREMQSFILEKIVFYQVNEHFNLPNYLQNTRINKKGIPPLILYLCHLWIV